MAHAIRVDLDERRTLGFTHGALRELDEELQKRYDVKFFDFITEFMSYVDEETGEVDPRALAAMDIGVINLAYTYALQLDDAKIASLIDEGRVDAALKRGESILDEALEESDLNFGSLLDNLIGAHPYLQAEETAEETSGDPLGD